MNPDRAVDSASCFRSGGTEPPRTVINESGHATVVFEAGFEPLVHRQGAT